jgi:hypothetical protein
MQLKQVYIKQQNTLLQLLLACSQGFKGRTTSFCLMQAKDNAQYSPTT